VGGREFKTVERFDLLTVEAPLTGEFGSKTLRDGAS
jgi:hypothetical protein